MKLEGQAAIVTGGGRGIGKAIALRLAKEGADVLIAGREEEDELLLTAEEIKKLGRASRAVLADVSSEMDVNAMIDACVNEFGKISILVNNAAIIGPTKLLPNVTRGEWDEVLAVNLTGPFLCAKAVLPHMMSNRFGKIINISSVAGKMAYPLRTPYAVSKWGLIGLTQSLAREAGPYNIQVNAVSPGPVAGPRMDQVIRNRAEELGRTFAEVERDFIEPTALKRMVQAADVAAVTLFLASEESNNITGQAIDVDAGYRL